KDLAGNETTVGPIRFFYHVSSPLTIQTNLNGVVITTNGVGQVLNAPKLFDGNATNLFVGRGYTLKAVETGAPKYILTNWTATWVGQTTPVVIQTNNLVCNFEMKEGMVISANFIDNPFFRFGGVYNGLFSDTENGVAFESAGFVTLKVTPKMGFSGKLFVDGNPIGFSGKLSIDGSGTALTKVRTKIADKPELLVSITLDFAGQTDTVSGTITEVGDAWSSSLFAHRVVWSTNKLASAFTNSYGMHIPGFANNNQGPVGTSYGAAVVNHLGKLKVGGFMSDGVPMKQGSVVSEDGHWPFFSALYPEKRLNNLGKLITETKGMTMGWLQFKDNEFDNKAPSGAVHWIKTDWTNTTYTAGFTNHNVEVVGSRWTFDPLAPGNSVAGLGSQVTVSFLDGDLGSSFSNDWSVTEKGGLMVIKLPKPDVYEYQHFVKTGLAAKTGLYKGTFLHPVSSLVVKHLGIVLQDYNLGAGFFMGPTVSGKTTLVPSEAAPQ
ncbi:MAG: hypothetical protein ACK4UN_06755, partial [Limisphaerales bacterium]